MLGQLMAGAPEEVAGVRTLATRTHHQQIGPDRRRRSSDQHRAGITIRQLPGDSGGVDCRIRDESANRLSELVGLWLTGAVFEQADGVYDHDFAIHLLGEG
jgi:hypothetical protein